MNRYEAILEAYRMLLINLEYNTEPNYKNGLLKIECVGGLSKNAGNFVASLGEVEKKDLDNDFGSFNFTARLEFLVITEDTYKKVEESNLFQNAKITTNVKKLAESLIFLGMNEQYAYIMASVVALHNNYPFYHHTK